VQYQGHAYSLHVRYVTGPMAHPGYTKYKLSQHPFRKPILPPPECIQHMHWTQRRNKQEEKFKLNKLSPVLFEFLKFILCMYPENIQKLHKYFLDINTIDSLHDSLPELRCVKLNN